MRRRNSQNGKEKCLFCLLVPVAKKMIFSKVVPRPFRMLKQVFLACFELVVTCFGPWKIPKCLEMGRFGTKHG